MDPDDTELALVPDARNYLVYCDEASIDSQRYYGWGTVWIPAEARGRLSGLFNRLKEEHFLSGDEVKWKKVNARTLPFFCALLDDFFPRSWILFHCLIVDTRIVRTELFEGGMTEARIHHLRMLLDNKISFFRGRSQKSYHIRVDPLPSPYRKEDEKLEKITNAMLRQKLGKFGIATLHTRDSKKSRGIQLADFLLGAALSPWNAAVDPGSPKHELSTRLYDALGWKDHLADTSPNALNFNIWHFHDKTLGARKVLQRPVKLRNPIKITVHRGP